jgi:hypothetical protein
MNNAISDKENCRCRVFLQGLLKHFYWLTDLSRKRNSRSYLFNFYKSKSLISR